MPGVIYRIGADNSDLKLNLHQAESMVDSYVKRAQAKLSGITAGGAMQWGSTQANRMGVLNSHMERTLGTSTRLNNSLDRMSGLFNTGLGIGAALGGFALLEKAFTRSLTKAREFQTAQIAIAATLQSSYKVMSPTGQELPSDKAFIVSQDKAAKFNKQIIERQARNILVYQEQLGAFQSSVAAGSRKGLTPEQVLDLSEKAAVVAKTLGLRGEQIANASRLLMGGGVNVARSTIGRALGISNQDIASKQGDEFAKFLESKMKGFKAAEPTFAKSIEGIMSTLEAKFDIFFAKVGTKFMDHIAPSLEQIGKALEGPGAEKFADTLATLFESLFKVLKSIIDSGALNIIAKFIEFLAQYGDKILIVGILWKMVAAVGSLVGGLSILRARLQSITAGATESATAMTALAGATEAANAAATGGGGLPLPRGARAAGAVPGLAGSAIDAGAMALAAERTGMKAPLSGGVTNFSHYRKQYDAAVTPLYYQELLKRNAIAREMGGKGASSLVDDAAMLAYPGAQVGAMGLWGKLNRPLFDTEKAIAGAPGFLRGLPGRITGGLGAAGGIAGIAGGVKGAIAGGLGAAGGAALTVAPLALLAALGYVGNKQWNNAYGQQQESESNLGEMYTQNPALKRIADVKDKLRETNQQLSTGKIQKTSGATSFWDALSGGAQDYEVDAMPKKLLQAKRDRLKKELEAEQELARSTLENATAVAKAAADIGSLTAKLKSLNFATGPEAAGRRIDLEGKKSMADLQTILNDPAQGLAIDADVAVAAKRAFADSQAAIKTWEQSQKGKAKPLPVPDEFYKTEDELQKEIQGNRLKANIEQTTKMNKEILKHQQSAYQYGLSPQITSQYKKGLEDVQAQTKGDWMAGKINAPLNEALANATKKFEDDFNMPIKRISASMEMINFGEPSEHVIDSAKLAFEVSRDKILKLAEQFNNIAGMGKMTDQAMREAQAKLEVTTALAKDTEAHRTILGGSPTDRMYTEGRIDLTQRELGRASLMEGALGNKSMQGLAGVGSDIFAQAKGGQFANRGQMNQYALATLGNFEFNNSQTWERQKLDDRKSTQQRWRMGEDYRQQREDLSFAPEQAKLGKEKAVLSRDMWTAGAPQFTEAAGAIRNRVDIEMAADKGWNADKYAADYKRSKEIDLREMDIGVSLAGIQEQRATSGQTLLRLEQDYALAVAETTLTLRDRNRNGMTQEDFDASQKRVGELRQNILSGKDLLAPPGVELSKLPPKSFFAGEKGSKLDKTEGASTTLNFSLEKVAMSDTEINTLADKVRLEIIEKLRRERSRS